MSASGGWLGRLKSLTTSLAPFFVLVPAVYGVIAYVDWRIDSALKNPEVLESVARRVRPFVVFNETGSISIDGGAMEYLQGISVEPIQHIDPIIPISSGLAFRIVVTPTGHLAYPPEIEPYGRSRAGTFYPYEPQRGYGHAWEYEIHYSAADSEVGKRFRLEVIR